MTERLSEFDLTALRPDTLAILLDFDGTLVAIADRPDAVVLAKRTVQTLFALRSVLGGAVAIVSGRSVEEIDRLFAPLKFAVAGTHGLERRDSRGNHHQGQFDRAALREVLNNLKAAFDGERGLLFEQKPGSIALHYRQRPELADTCREEASKLVDKHEGARLLTGKMVVEVKLGERTKADAVFDFMAEAPFSGRAPIYAGDDVTDEDAFHAVATLHGTSIKIGCNQSAADYCVSDTETFLAWLDALTANLHAKLPGSKKETLQ